MSSPSAPPAEFSDLSKRYAGITIFDGLSGRLEAGACLALVSRNGSGKSTLLGCLTGHVAPDGGTVRIAGHSLLDPKSAIAARAQLRYLPQESPAPKQISGREFVEFHAQLFGAEQQVDAALARSGIESELYDLPLASYSVGMRRRIHFAAITLGQAACYLLDEPFAGLDQKGRDLVLQWLDERRRAGAGLLLAAHSHEDRELKALDAQRCSWLAHRELNS